GAFAVGARNSSRVINVESPTAVLDQTKLWRLVNNPANIAIRWNEQGHVIIIDQHLFEEQILSPSSSASDNVDAFKTTNFSSFVRQLNLYGFKKADMTAKDVSVQWDCVRYHYFYNPNFLRNRPELVASLRRLTVQNKAMIQAGRLSYQGAPGGEEM
uniref:HSF-type DNA-binding domain-containing protein n=1 Tax=Cyclopterus lumpus TaxID=8103 RepID=A0A8C2ZD91_CYCLU